MRIDYYDIEPTVANLIDSFINDNVGRNKDILSFTKFCCENEGNCSVAIDALWGQGKTFFIKTVQLIIDAKNHKKELTEEEINKVEQAIVLSNEKINKSNWPKLGTVYYDAWKHDNDVDPLLSLIYEITQQVEGCSLDNNKSLIAFFGEVVNCLARFDINKLLEQIKHQDDLYEIKNERRLDKAIKTFFAEILKHCRGRIIVFIDELDRCRPDYAIRLLERIKHYLSIESILFVFAVNFEQLQHSIRKFYGQEFNSARYLERFFNWHIMLPEPNMEKYHYKLGLYNSSNIYETVCKNLINRYHLSIREQLKFYRVAKTAAFKPTHLHQYYPSEDTYVFCCMIIVPLLIILSMVDSSLYNDFVKGRNGAPLIEFYKDTGVSNYLVKKLFDRSENKSDNS